MHRKECQVVVGQTRAVSKGHRSYMRNEQEIEAS